MDVINLAFAESLKAHTLFPGKNNSSKSLKTTTKEKVETAPTEGSKVSSSVMSNTSKEISRDSSDVGSDVAEISPIEPPSTAENDGSKQAQDEIVEVNSIVQN